uniref:Transcription factor CP2-like n=1 Tax=Hirondellea gigas TaxID=1518452 RepID=A0A6A7G2M3_9CRUS
MKFTSRIRISFHERRFQFVEREQLSQWQQIRPNERIVEIDVPLSYGITDVQQCKSKLTVVQFDWDPNKDVAAYIKVNCISTEFTQRKHGGEKGVPFRIQIETYASNNGIMERLFVCGCQIKVFKLKGADRKHKQDRDKISKLSASEREKYQESCDCTIMTPYTGDMVYQPDDDGNNSSDNNEAANDSTNNASLFAINPEQQPQQLQQQQQQQPSSGPCSRTQTPVGIGGGPPQPPPIHLHQGQPNTASSSSSVSSSGGGGGGGGNSNNNSCSSTTEASPIEQRKQHAFTPNMRSDRGFSPAPSPADQDSFNSISGGSGGGGNSAVLEGDETAAALQHWLALHRFSQHAATFANFAATDILRLSRQEMIQICGLADGIRLFNALHAKSLAPRLTLYVCAEGERLYTAVYLERATYRELSKKLAALLAIHRTSIQDIYMIGPAGVHVKLNDEVVRNFPDECLLMCSAYTTSPVATPIEESKPFATQQQQLFTVVLSVQPKTVSNTSNVILTPPTRGLALHDHSSSVGNSGVLDIGPSNFGIQLQPLPPPPPHLHHQSSPSSQQPPPPPRSLFRAHPIVPVVSSLPMTLPHNIASSHLIVSSQSVGSPSCIVPSHVSENLHVNVNVGPTAVVNAQYNASRIGGVATSSTSSTFGDAFIVPRVPNSNVVNSSSTNSVSSNGNNCITSHSSCGGSNNSSNIIINSSESLSLSSTSSLSPINNSGQIDFFENVAGGSSSSSNDEQMLNNSPSPNAQQQQQHHHHRQSQQQQHQNHHPQQQQRKHSHGHLSSPPMQSSGNFSRASPSLNRLNINGSNQGNSFQTPVSGPQAQFEPPCSASGSINTTTQFHS